MSSKSKIANRLQPLNQTSQIELLIRQDTMFHTTTQLSTTQLSTTQLSTTQLSTTQLSTTPSDRARLHNASLPLILLITSIMTLASQAMASPEIPGAPQKKPIAIIGATIHPVSGKVIENGTIIFDKGKIIAIGRNVNIPAEAIKIDGRGKHVYPGLFDAFTNIGLVEINAVRATNDHTETGTFNPNVRAEVSVNPDSEMIPVTRSNGVLLALTAPAGGRISGRSAVLQLDGWSFEDLTLKSDVAIHVQWPNVKSGESNGDIKKLRDFIEKARDYVKAKNELGDAQPIDLRLEGMRDVLEKRTPMIVHADRLATIQTAVAFAVAEDLKLIIYGGYDAPHCVELLKKHDVPVVVGGVYRLPMRTDDAYDTAYTVAARLHLAGVKFCISGEGRFGASNVRNLPYHAAMAAAFGLPQDEALRAITLSPAEILGVADRVGSLEVGKHATLILTNGNPLETPTLVEAAYVQGRTVELNDRHKRLWKKYETKQRRQ
ncbi:MAG: imidazolonepropionase-like amidohydrolase [Pirellulaceae bacterium]|jgi:imidazolonepropionase-like amidohydrolase